MLAERDRRRIATALHAHPARMVLVVAGGGNALITDLLDVPGASRTVLEVVVPYAETSMAEFVDRPGESLTGIVSAEHAAAMARAARRRAMRLAPTATELCGVAVTAALVSDRVKRGDHRAHIAIADGQRTTTERVDLVKGELDRAGEDRRVADAALLMLERRFGEVAG